MTRDTAKRFWKEYIKLACAKGSDSIMLNPSHTLISQVHMGKFDEMSDDEYAIRLKDVEELSLC